jgi:hypothetical protein
MPGEALEVTFALFTIALVLLVASLEFGSSIPSQLARLRARGEDRSQAPPPKPPVTSATTRMAVGADVECAEAVLTAHLLAGRLSAAQYRQGMAVLAAQDAVRRPLVVPPARGI